METNVVVGLDIGGTNIKAGLVDPAGRLLKSETFPTEAASGRDSLLKRICDIVLQMKEQAEQDGRRVLALGIGTAGYVNAKEGRIGYATSNLPEWTGVPLRQELEARTGVPVALANDAHAFAVGEAWIGAGRSWPDFVCVTLGTGVGGCVVLDGRPFYGKEGYAGGFGHHVIRHDGRPCNCGQAGCWEQYASVTALVRQAAEAGIDVGGSAKALFDEARRGDERALAVIDRYAEYVAVGLVNLIHTLNPPAVIVGGAVTAQGDFLFDRIRAQVRQRCMPVYADVAIVPAELGAYSGLAGAARLAFHRLSEAGA